jgi:SAM-dependent methyltransferase
VLDVGCGTGSLAIAIARLHPAADVVGIDPDPKALARARRKAARAGVSIQFDGGFADGLPYPDAAFDHLLSSFMFHHLEGNEKAGMFHEARRVLKPGGFLYLLDFEGPESGTPPVAGAVAAIQPATAGQRRGPHRRADESGRVRGSAEGRQRVRGVRARRLLVLRSDLSQGGGWPCVLTTGSKREDSSLQ